MVLYCFVSGNWDEATLLGMCLLGTVAIKAVRPNVFTEFLQDCFHLSSETTAFAKAGCSIQHNI